MQDVELTGMWKKEKDNEWGYILVGQLGRVNLVIHPNPDKQKIRDPDAMLFFTERRYKGKRKTPEKYEDSWGMEGLV
jgi:hypothetical protein